MEPVAEALYGVGYCIALGFGIAICLTEARWWAKLLAIFVLPFFSWVTIGFYMGLKNAREWT